MDLFDLAIASKLSATGGGGGGGGLTLLKTESLGTISSSSTDAVDLGKPITISGLAGYDLLVLYIRKNGSGGHLGTISFGIINTNGEGYADYSTALRSAIAFATGRLIFKESVSRVSSKQANSYGIYAATTPNKGRLEACAAVSVLFHK